MVAYISPVKKKLLKRLGLTNKKRTRASVSKSNLGRTHWNDPYSNLSVELRDPLKITSKITAENIGKYYIDRNALAAKLCKASFKDFVKEFWSVVIAEEMRWNWHMDYICDELQKVAERVFRWEQKAYDLIINVPPGSSKSTIASIMFPAWCWTRMPSFRTISASYAHDLAQDLSRKSRSVVQSPKYKLYFPDVAIDEEQNTKSYFANTKLGFRRAVGAGGTITGQHGHCIIVDDPINPKEALSTQSLKTINQWMQETLPSRKVDKMVVPTILIMQRLHQDDPTGAMLRIARKKKEGSVKHICLPAILAPNVSPRALRSRYVNGLLDPVRMPREVLREALADLGDYGYAGQFGQSPVPRGGGMFKPDRVIADRVPVIADFKRVVRYWDKAGTRGGGAYTVGALMGLDVNNRFWILDVIRVQLDASEREKLMKQTAEDDRFKWRSKMVIVIEQEPGSGGKDSALNSVKNLAGFNVKLERPQGDKTARADPWASQMNAGNVYRPQGADWWRALEDELRFFPNSRLKDQVDACSAGFNVLNTFKKVAGGLGSNR